MTQPTTPFSFGDILLVPFPFTDQTASKKRPAVVISSAMYQQERQDLIVMPITSQVRPVLAFGEVMVTNSQASGLLKPSVIKPVIAPSRRAWFCAASAVWRGPIGRRCRACCSSFFGESDIH